MNGADMRGAGARLFHDKDIALHHDVEMLIKGALGKHLRPPGELLPLDQPVFRQQVAHFIAGENIEQL